MGRRGISLECSAEDWAEMARIGRSHKEPKRRVERSRIILKGLDVVPQGQIAKELGVRPNTVSVWKHCFALKGLAGLEDTTRSGRRKVYDADYEARVLKTLEKKSPKGQAVWDGPALLATFGGSLSAVWRFLRKSYESLVLYDPLPRMNDVRDRRALAPQGLFGGMGPSSAPGF